MLKYVFNIIKYIFLIQSIFFSLKFAKNDPWKSKTGGLVDMKRLKEKRGIEIVKNMHSNFAKETNQRDEDAEMQKFIEEQLNLKKEQEKNSKAADTSKHVNELLVALPTITKFKRPEDALFDVPKYLIENTSKHKSEETLSEQMLSGIPEVDLGIDERIRNIEETEKAKQSHNKKKNQTNNSSNSSIQSKQSGKQTTDSQYAPHNTSVNFVQHKRFDDALINPDHMIKPRINRPNTSNTVDLNQPVVGDAPKHELLQQTNQAHASSSSGYSIKSKNNRSNPNIPNQNARRQYFVSTNMNEKEIETESISIDKEPVTVNVVEPSVSTEPVKKTHKRGHSKSNNQTVDKASDDYCLERFKKNMRHNRNSKIKIC